MATTDERRAMAQRTADALGITLYLRDDGAIEQHPPGTPIDPKSGSRPAEHASFDPDKPGIPPE